MSKPIKSKPHIEHLEDRQLMAFFADYTVQPLYTWTVVTPTPLVVDGGLAPDTIYISQDTAGNLLVNKNGVVSTHPAWMVSKVVVNAFDGNDFIYAYSNVSTPIEAYGGLGNDSVYGGAAADTLVGGDHNDYLVGNDGNDRLDGGSQGVWWYDVYGNDSLFGMNGDDVLFASNSGNSYLNGGYGADSLYGFNGAENIVGGAGNDYVYSAAGNDVISGGTENDIVYAGPGDDVIHGDAGNDFLVGDDGNDRLYADAGEDAMAGGNGNDTLVSIGGGQTDRVAGNAGYDSFWCDAEITEQVLDADWFETANGHVHRVAGFRSYNYASGAVIPVGRELLGQNLAEPINGGTALISNVASNPLFATAGPTKDDIDQDGIGDCYYLATLSAIARVNPDRIRQSVVELGDRTYAVRFFKDGAEQYFRVDGDLPTKAANAGLEKSTWVQMMEKAWAFFRNNDSDWNSIEGGWMDEVFAAMGVSAETFDLGLDSWNRWLYDADEVWDYVNGQLSAGKAVTVGTGWSSGMTLIDLHAYTVDRAYIAPDGTRRFVLRNPHGSAGNPRAYVDISAEAFYHDVRKVQSAYD